MKADKYRFDGARTCDLRALSCDSKEDATDKDEILAKTAEKRQKIAALELNADAAHPCFTGHARHGRRRHGDLCHERLPHDRPGEVQFDFLYHYDKPCF